MASAGSMQTAACVLSICMTCFPSFFCHAMHASGICIVVMRSRRCTQHLPSVMHACCECISTNSHCTTAILQLLAFTRVMCPCLACVYWHKSLELFGVTRWYCGAGITVALATIVPGVLKPLVPSAEGIAAILMQVTTSQHCYQCHQSSCLCSNCNFVPMDVLNHLHQHASPPTPTW